MSWLSRSKNPVDRAMRELDRKLAAVQRQARILEVEASHHGPARLSAKAVRADAASMEPSSPAMNGFVNQMLSQSEPHVRASYRTTPAAFDAGMDAMELEAGGAVVARGGEPDLFTHSKQPSPESGSDTRPKLAQYLGAGSFRNQKPLRYMERQARNKFMMWLGLSFTALWLVYIVVR